MSYNEVTTSEPEPTLDDVGRVGLAGFFPPPAQFCRRAYVGRTGLVWGANARGRDYQNVGSAHLALLGTRSPHLRCDFRHFGKPAERAL